MEQEASRAVKAFCEEIKEVAFSLHVELSSLLTRHLELNCQLLAPVLFLPGTSRLGPKTLTRHIVRYLIVSEDGKRSVEICFEDRYARLSFQGSCSILQVFPGGERSTEAIDFAVEHLLPSS